jgi:hypothetical protein
MSLKYNVVLVWVTCFCHKVVVNGYEVVLVNRNVTDSFRVGQDGCTNDKFVCPDFSTCQSDGFCLCNFTRPNYRNPVIEMIDGHVFLGDWYGCIDNDVIEQIQISPYLPAGYSV